MNCFLLSSEFEELEAVPTSAVIEGPLEPAFPTSASTDVPDDPSFVNFFSVGVLLLWLIPNLLVPLLLWQSGASEQF